MAIYGKCTEMILRLSSIEYLNMMGIALGYYSSYGKLSTKLYQIKLEPICCVVFWLSLLLTSYQQRNN